ncbi:MAG: three-Cys-motif partner protein TcmP [Dehalococcoidaceae bacterium]|nr:three-Cys-motif partner protein TcmP [Dehalococcoidaceae bacterium]
MQKQPDPQPVSKAVCHKLECLGDFLAIYSTLIKAGRYYYLELFAGQEFYTCKETGVTVPGLSRRAVSVRPGFGGYILVKPANSPETAWPTAGDNLLTVRGNLIQNTTLRRIFDRIPRSSSIFCIIDPPGYRRLRWTTMKKLITSGTNWQGQRMDLLMLLPVEMAIVKNLNRPKCAASLTRFFGTTAWKEINNSLVSGRISAPKAREMLVEIYTSGLKSLGYRHVESLNPVKPNRTPLYYIIWASDSDSRLKQIKNIWSKTRFLPGEMFHQQ